MLVNEAKAFSPGGAKYSGRVFSSNHLLEVHRELISLVSI
jgi:hypothetical protein